MSQYMTAYSVMKEFGFFQPTMLQAAFMTTLNTTRNNTLTEMAEELRRTPSSIKYTVGAMACAGMVDVKDGQIMITQRGKELKLRMPHWVLRAEEGRQAGISSFYEWALLDSIHKNPSWNVSTHAKSVGIRPSSALRCVDRLESAGILTGKTVYGRGTPPEKVYTLTGRGETLYAEVA